MERRIFGEGKKPSVMETIEAVALGNIEQDISADAINWFVENPSDEAGQCVAIAAFNERPLPLDETLSFLNEHNTSLWAIYLPPNPDPRYSEPHHRLIIYMKGEYNLNTEITPFIATEFKS